MSYNSIRSFQLPSGEFITDPIAMGYIAVNHFKAILGPAELTPPPVHSTPDWFHACIGFCCPENLIPSLVSIPTAEEITKMIFRLNTNKAPGPDGLTSGFFKASWSLLGDEVAQSIIHFFHTSFLPSSTNSTILALIPKRPGASAISDFRPIALLNTIYKVISRLLVKRLKPILPSLIVPNQTAFVKDRLMVENTVLAAELVHGYHKRKGPKRITIKVDIAKAFDTLSWEFLFNCLQGLQLPEVLLKRLKACICSPSFMIGYNGSVQGYFKGRRGLRQGDPLSPYLFVIAMNVLSIMLNKAAHDLKFNYHSKCSSSKLTHLCFADDLLIFIDGSLESVQNVLQILREFELRSGLAVSVEKSSFFASGLTQQELDVIKVSTGMPHGQLPVRYLGVPLTSKKLSIQNCEVMIQQVKGRLNSWSAKSLSFAGRLLLIKTVIAGINNFWCSSFILPKACINRINSLCGLFLWRGKAEGPSAARVAWEKVTKPKSNGGLGIKDLSTWNKASCLKLVWLLFFQSGSVWVAWFKTEVLHGDLSNYWIVKTNPKFSWLANKLIKMRDEVYAWIKMRIGNGRKCRFWTDNWSPFGSLEKYLSRPMHSRLGISATATLSELFSDGHWLLPPARTEQLLQVQIHLTTISLVDEDDHYEWVLNDARTKRYSIGEVYRKLRNEEEEAVPWAKIVWINAGIPKHSFLTWLFVLNRCPTRDRLLSWGLQTDSACLLCNTGAESRDHLFFQCRYTWDLWQIIAVKCGLIPERDWNGSISQLQQLQGNRIRKRLTYIGWQAAIYWSWNERNNRLHRRQFKTVDSLFRLLDRQIKDKILSMRQSNPINSSRLMQMWV